MMNKTQTEYNEVKVEIRRFIVIVTYWYTIKVF